ncbi:MAG: hypothetical protein ABJL67_19515 [Sulfitobacter sp.]
METVTLKLPPKLLTDAARVASGQDVTIGHLVRVLLAKEVERRLNPKTPMRADEGLLAALQALLARDMAEASGWSDLAARLKPQGYELRPAGGGISLHKSSCGTRVCKGSELGFSYRTLVERFRAAMPEHPRGSLDLTFPEYHPDTKPLTPHERENLRRNLGPLFNVAGDWNTLITGFARRNYELRPLGDGLAVYTTGQGRHVCNTTTFGHRYSALMKRFGGPMPYAQQGCSTQAENPNQEIELQVIE